MYQSRSLMHELETYLVKICMEQCRSLNSHLKVLSNKDLAGTRSEYGFKRAFPSLFGEDFDIFTNMIFENVNQLEKQLASEEVHENESKATFRVIKEQFQQFIKSRSSMACLYFFKYTRIEVETFQDILIRDLDSIEKAILHRRNYVQRVNEQKLQIQEEQSNMVDALEANLGVMESNGT
jgi:hypothetical protein